MLWITPEVANSPIITGVEIPGLTTRSERGDGFYLLPVAAGGLDYDTAARAARAVNTLNDFAAWNVVRVPRDPIHPEDAVTVARRALARRVAAIHTTLPPDAPFIIDLYTRAQTAKHPDAALTVDFTHRFDGRHVQPEAWQQCLQPALNAIVDTVATRAPGRPLHCRGLIGLPAALALGTTLLAPRGLSATWMQHTPGWPNAAPYSLTAGRKNSGFRVVIRDGQPAAKDLAVLINVSETTVPAIQGTEGLPDFRGFVQADPPGVYPHLFAEAAEAVDLAHQIIETIRAARARYGELGDLHLFIAGPVGLALLLGQLFNTLGPVHTYEHVNDDGTGHYSPAVTLRPAG